MIKMYSYHNDKQLELIIIICIIHLLCKIIMIIIYLVHIICTINFDFMDIWLN